jgi:hypothetical protein
LLGGSSSRGAKDMDANELFTRVLMYEMNLPLLEQHRANRALAPYVQSLYQEYADRGYPPLRPKWTEITQDELHPMTRDNEPGSGQQLVGRDMSRYQFANWLYDLRGFTPSADKYRVKKGTFKVPAKVVVQASAAQLAARARTLTTVGKGAALSQRLDLQKQTGAAFGSHSKAKTVLIVAGSTAALGGIGWWIHSAGILARLGLR